MTDATYDELVLGYIRREFGPLKHAAKILARLAHATPRCAKNWLEGHHAPNGDKLLHLMAACDDLAAEINELVAKRRAASRDALLSRARANLEISEKIDMVWGGTKDTCGG